jgi:hypothetical protein
MSGDPYDLTQQLTEACERAGLVAKIVAPTRVRVNAPGANERLTEIVKCMPDREERLMWWWSWDEPICPVTDLDQAVRKIAYVVTPSTTC